MNYNKFTYPDVNNGLGCRVTLWINGCTHYCEGCHNHEMWDFLGGKKFTEQSMNELFSIVSKPYIKGLTLSGGDPLNSANDVYPLILEYRKKFGNKKDIWLYTGYKIQDILDIPMNETKEEKEIREKQEKIIRACDYIVDGVFEIKKRDITLAFRGSSNQNIYHIVNKSIDLVNLD